MPSWRFHSVSKKNLWIDEKNWQQYLTQLTEFESRDVHQHSMFINTVVWRSLLDYYDVIRVLAVRAKLAFCLSRS